MKSRFLIGAVVIIALGVFGVAFLQRPAAPVPAATNAAQAQTSVEPGMQASGYTLAQVAQHNSASSCWATINGNVYDLTDWIGRHPGGPQRILSICGTDGSAAFNGQHGGQARPASELSNFLLGPLNR